METEFTVMKQAASNKCRDRRFLAKPPGYGTIPTYEKFEKIILLEEQVCDGDTSVQIIQDKIKESGHIPVLEMSFNNRYNLEIMLKTLNDLMLAVPVSITRNGISTETKIKGSLLKLYNTITIIFVIGFVSW